ncbi:unnamed protein product (macronuclear) [Paramecium tetraurelia]|uniref:USP domain-containing protein n=1 Tax=Paramecium tetraurelia TaxID=5888 RepID=A0CHP4_PARTE|nr:uncharacterized protein GSPATT00038413001 [Paramecium tetraurelia]CAK70311.1 unnamed protein product [Paramecium tetraurelia]|eukprot:XP_001437708.1 hypothetical protein (macronuclear) [Paramecium tetraurelia strain d4-2]
MIIFDSQMKQNENIEDESEDKQLYVPLFPMRKKPSIGSSQISSQSTSQSTQMLTQYRSMQDSNEKRELEATIIKELMKDKRSNQFYAVRENWISQYKQYLYQNGERPVNEAVWIFFKQEYKAQPDIICKQKHSRSNDKRSKTVEPQINRQSVSTTQSNYELPLIGMKNDSYFCYMHSGLQSLLSIADLNYFIIKYIQRIPKEKKRANIVQYTSAYFDLIDQIKASTIPVKINALKTLIINQFHPKNQHDCHEFLLYLLGHIEDEILNFNKDTKSNYINFIDQIFKGKLQTGILCQLCNYKVKQIEPFLTLSLAISQSKTLEQCLEEFLKEETLRDYKCTKCQSSCIKSLQIISIPQILVLHLKRFQFLPQCHKNNKTITYPMDTLKFGNQTYRLRAVIVHTGNLQSGHYFTFAKRYHQWFLFNDETVKAASKKQVLMQSAYILFYQINENP